jgi:hypothetical protein
MQRKPCWGESDKIAMIDTVLRGWVCPPIYIIPRLDWTTECSEGEDHIFDGAHKLEAVFDVIDGKFAFKAPDGSKFVEYSGKQFEELPRDIQDKIKKYRFQINHVDAETASSPDELRILWERVNKAGMKLHKFELEIPLIDKLLETVVKPVIVKFRGTVFFPKLESKRGELEQRLQVVLALSDMDDLNVSSQNSLVSRWHIEKLGASMAERDANIATHGDRWRDTFIRVDKMLGELIQLNVFCNAEGECIIGDTHRKTELPFTLGRLARHFPRIEDFRSQKMAIASRLKEEIFAKSPHDLSVELGGTGRNGSFQKKLLKHIDDIVQSFIDLVQPRLFTKAQKKAKLKEQGGKCTACSKKILHINSPMEIMSRNGQRAVRPL